MTTPSAADSFYRLRVFLHRFRFRLLAGFFIPFLLMAALSFLPTKRYTAEAVLIIRLGPEYLYQPEALRAPTAPNPPIPFNRDQIFKSEVAILSSSDLHHALIEEMGTATLFPELTQPTGISAVKKRLRAIWQRITSTVTSTASANPEEEKRQALAHATALFERRFEITLEKESAVMRLSFQHVDAAIATQTLDTLLNRYFEKRREFYRDDRVALAHQLLDAKRKEANAAASALEAFKQQHQLYAFDEQRAELLSERHKAQALTTTFSHRGLSNKLAELNKNLAALAAIEEEFKRLQSDAATAQQAVVLFTQHLDAAKAHEERLREQVQSVRVVQAPTASAEPASTQPLILTLGAVLAFISALLTAIYSEYSYNTSKVVTILKQRRKSPLWRVK